MARPKHGHPPGILFHSYQRHMFRDLDSRSGGTGRQNFIHLVSLGGLCTRVAEQALGSIMVVLQLCRWIMDVSGDRNGAFEPEC